MKEENKFFIGLRDAMEGMIVDLQRKTSLIKRIVKRERKKEKKLSEEDKKDI